MFCSARSSSTNDPQDVRLMRLTNARLFDERLSEPQEALAQLRAILEIHPGTSRSWSFWIGS